MRASARLGLPLCLTVSLLIANAAPPVHAERPSQEPQRTLYFAARDATGSTVADLTATELTLTARGQGRTIVSLHKATEPMQVAVIVNDGGNGEFQSALAEFLQSLLGYGTFSIRALDRQPPKILDDTGDAAALRAALQSLGRRRPGMAPPDLVDAIGEAATELRRQHARRPVIVVLTTGGESLDDRGTDIAAKADAALGSLQRSGASLHVLLNHFTGVGPALADGTARSGGVIDDLGQQGLIHIRQTLLSQYALTYVAPDGKKADTGLVLRTSRSGVRIIAPTTAVAPD